MDSLRRRLRRSLFTPLVSAIDRQTHAYATSRRERRRTRTWALVALLVAASAVALAIAVARTQGPLAGEAELARDVQAWGYLNETATDVIRALTTSEVVIAIGGAAAIGLWLQGRRREAVAVVLTIAVLPIVQTAIKEIVDRPRPSPDLVDLRAGYTSPSFPAGHVMSPVAVYGLLLLLAFARSWAAPARGVLAIVVVPLLILTGPVNVYLGVHWPSDVAGAYLWGLLLLVVFAWVAMPPIEADTSSQDCIKILPS